MVSGRLGVVLSALQNPQTPAEIARTLGSPETVVAGMLHTLLQKGYVSLAQPPQKGGCGACNLKSFCSNADAPSDRLELHLYRLTPKGMAALAS